MPQMRESELSSKMGVKWKRPSHEQDFKCDRKATEGIMGECEKSCGEAGAF